MVSWRFEGQHVNHNKRLPPAAAQLPRDARQGPPLAFAKSLPPRAPKVRPSSPLAQQKDGRASHFTPLGSNLVRAR